LFAILNNEIGKDTIFKGGTALSKCYNMIERFAEDIDFGSAEINRSNLSIFCGESFVCGE
jgi:predicted nucleotidyltransferase component of viral defense system